MNTRLNYLKEQFINKFGYNPGDFFESPGRIELLGNHTDHNHGLVLVSSVDLNITSAVNINDKNIINIYSDGYEMFSVDINDLAIKEEEFCTSKAIVKGILNRFKELNYKIGGFDAYMDSTVPNGAGVSSSAAFELLIGVILNDYYNDNKLTSLDLAKIAQYSENVYFNKPCGLLDQCGIAFGGINYIDFKDTNNPDVKNIKVEFDNYQFILIKTGGTHEKLTSYYASIKDDMLSVSKYFNKQYLRECSYSDFINNKIDIINVCGHKAYDRAYHFFTENLRVIDAYNALINNDQVGFLNNLKESGLSSYNYLKNCYCESEEENLPKALNFIKNVDKECFSRVHGGGFAGTALMIVKKENLVKDLEKLNEYFGKENVILVKPTLLGTHKL